MLTSLCKSFKKEWRDSKQTFLLTKASIFSSSLGWKMVNINSTVCYIGMTNCLNIRFYAWESYYMELLYHKAHLQRCFSAKNICFSHHKNFSQILFNKLLRKRFFSPTWLASSSSTTNIFPRGSCFTASPYLKVCHPIQQIAWKDGWSWRKLYGNLPSFLLV